MSNYTFQQASVSEDTFTQLLGINDFAEVVGYHGAAVNQGVTLTLPNSFTTENVPGAAMTQVVGINNFGQTDGFYVDQNGVTNGFSDTKGVFTTVDAPGSAFTQLLGINDFGEEAGYSSIDPAGATQQQAFLHTAAGGFSDVRLPTNVNSQATGVNDFGTAVGFYQPTATTAEGFIDRNGHITTLTAPGSTFTQALGINNLGEVVGDEVDANGVTHGFVYQAGKYTIVDAPNSTSTVINGVNDFGILTGFSVDATTGNTNGFVAAKPLKLSLHELTADLLPHAAELAQAAPLSHPASTTAATGSHLHAALQNAAALIIGHHT